MTATDTNTVNDTKLTCVAAVQMEGPSLTCPTTSTTPHA